MVALLVSTLVIFILGWLWYSPLLFFKPWVRARGMDPAAAMVSAKMPAARLVIELIRCFVVTYVVAHFVVALGVTAGLAAIHFAFFLWLGVPVMLLIGSVIWENVPIKVATIHAGDWLIKLLVISLLVSKWG
ncbi:MAG: DUF1761 domain-containing protein [Gemmatimonadales bacterium]